MGLMYWQINDIWQGPTWATVEYGLKWKMGHYYVQHMYEPVYPLPILTPYLANTSDESARISLYVINEQSNPNRGLLTCSLYPLDSFTAKSTLQYPVQLNSTGVLRISELPYATVMKNAGCATSNQCVLRCFLNSTEEEMGQTLFFTQPKNYQLQQPNVRISSITKVSSTQFRITVTAERPALFVWLDTSINKSGYFSRNGFHMFESSRTVTYNLWEPTDDLTVQVMSLYDVTQV